MTPTDVCRAALCEAGWPELAGEVEPNRVDNPMRPNRALTATEATVYAQAWRIAHMVCRDSLCGHNHDKWTEWTIWKALQYDTAPFNNPCYWADASPER